MCASSVSSVSRPIPKAIAASIIFGIIGAGISVVNNKNPQFEDIAKGAIIGCGVGLLDSMRDDIMNFFIIDPFANFLFPVKNTKNIKKKINLYENF